MLQRVSRGSSRVVRPVKETSFRPWPNNPPSITNYTPKHDVAPEFSGIESNATPIGRPCDLPEILYVPDVMVDISDHNELSSIFLGIMNEID